MENCVNLRQKGVLLKIMLTEKTSRTPCQALNIFKEGVEIMGDECSPVGWILSPSGARNNY